MNRFIRGMLLMMVCNAITVQAQITITTNDFPGNPGTTIYYTTTTSNTIPVNLGSPGANQTWNFSSINTTQGLVINWVSPSSTPFASQFPTANRCSEMDLGTFKSYAFDLLTSSGFTPLGSGLTAQDTIYSLSVFTRTEPTFLFPATYGMQWTSVFENPNTPTITVLDSCLNAIDAWGTLTDQSGTYPCLRHKQHYYLMTYQNGNLIATNTLWVYSWYVPIRGSEISISSVSNESNPNFTMGYFTRETQILAVQPLPAPQILPTLLELSPAYPNPFNANTILNFTLPRTGDVSLTIFDDVGRQVRNLVQGHYHTGAYQVTFYGSGLTSGVYFAKLTSDGAVLTQRITLLK
jgi:hypothetical protein